MPSALVDFLWHFGKKWVVQVQKWLKSVDSDDRSVTREIQCTMGIVIRVRGVRNHKREITKKAIPSASKTRDQSENIFFKFLDLNYGGAFQ